MKNKDFSQLRKFVCLILLTQLIFCQFIFTQDRGMTVKVKKDDGQAEEVQLYKASYALVIGVSDYTNGWKSLPGVKNDVKAVSDVLKEQGFQVETVLNPKRLELTAAVEKFIREYGYDFQNRLLIYYAGHGHTQKRGTGDDQGFIIPADAPVPKNGNESELRRMAISMDTIERYAQEIDAKHVLFLFDSCFSGALISQTRSAVPPMITYKATQPVRQFITAGTDNQEVPDVSEFRKQFVEGLKGDADINLDGYITASELADFLQDKVSRYSRGSQTPQFGKIRDARLDKGDFVFTSPRRIQPSPTPQILSTGEVAFWQAIENSTDTSDFEDYLGRIKSGEFNGIYKATAELKLRRLKSTAQVSSVEPKPTPIPTPVPTPIPTPVPTPKLTATPIPKPSVTPTVASTVETKPNTSSTSANNSAWSAFSSIARKLKQYDFVDEFKEGLAEVRIGGVETGKHGFINEIGDLVVPVKYDRVWDFSEGLAVVMIKDKQGMEKEGIIDKTGKFVIPLQYNGFGSFSEGLASGFNSNGKVVFIDKTGKVVISTKYDYTRGFSEGLASVSLKNGKEGFIDKTGKLVIPLMYDEANSFSNGLASVYINKKSGFIDKTGKEVVPLKYDLALSFRDGLAAVKLNKKSGFIDTTGKEVIPLKYDYGLSSFSEGIGSERTNGKYGYLDKAGNEITPFKYDLVLEFQGGLGQVILNGKDGFVDKTGKEIIPPKYKAVWCDAFRKEGFIGVTLNGKKGFVDLNGNEYFDF